MAPPPGRKRSYKSIMAFPTTIDGFDSVDANPSEALTSQIASAVLKERHSLRNRPITETATSIPSVDNEHPISQLKESPEWESAINCPAPPPARSSTAGSRSSSRASQRRLKSKPRGIQRYSPSGEATEDDEDPFVYDGATQAKAPTSQICTEKDRFRGYPCPFRRRNPIRFNIRDHENCGRKPFLDIAELKCHIRMHHQPCQNVFRCPRCKSQLSSAGALTDHLTVPVDELCEPQLVATDHQVEDGITEYMDRLLVSTSPSNAVQSWDDLWRLLFPQDAAVLDPEFLPVIEVFEAEQEYDDNAAELKTDLCDSLRRLLPDQSSDALFYSVLAGQLSLVFEQHRANINRRCRTAARATTQKPSTKPSASLSSSSYSRAAYPDGKTRRSQLRSVAPPSPTTSSVYSSQTRGSSSTSSSRHSRPTTRSSIISAVESPRLPFRDWVHNVAAKPAVTTTTPPPLPPPPPVQQRDSGLAMLPCDEDDDEDEGPCYADQLSAFLTPAVVRGLHQPSGLTPYGQEEDEWSCGDALLSARIQLGRDGKIFEGFAPSVQEVA